MYERFGKRAVDISIASIAIILLGIPMLFVAVWVKIDSPGPILFKQLRYGKGLKPFRVYKFRSMSVEAPRNTPTNDFSDSDSYITSAGKIMRKLSLDELPQLFNVLKSEMSIVGPRPVVLKEHRLIELRGLVNANRVKPGITGWAQVNGRDELNDVLKARMDGVYVENIGMRMDFECLLLTLGAVLSIKGNREGYESTKEASDVLDFDANVIIEEV